MPAGTQRERMEGCRLSDIWIGIIMGIVEGLTEFLPVSSSGHMILTAHLLDFTGERAKTFEIVVQFGAVLAVLVLYRRRFLSLLNFNLAKSKGLNALHVVMAMFPTFVAAVLFYSPIKTYLFGPMTVVWALVAGGILMIVAEKANRRITAETLDDLTYRQAFGIGCFQILSLWPGFSRSGSTISGGMLLGASKTAAAEFTFIVSVPIMFGASGYDLYKSWEYLDWADWPLFLTGLVASFLVAMLAVVTFINLLKRISYTWFAVYRFLLAAVFFFVIL
ncbi:UDP pyrophosphate phosphatase [Paenibacillus sp. 32O-W]|nr:UDP pyrophosphate phosphatase [Paenibacillus sp. 32O-W]